VTPNTKLNLIEVVGDFFNPKQIEELFEQLNIRGTTTEYEIQPEDSPDISISSSAITKAQIDLLITYASSRLKEDNFLALLLLLSNASLTLGDFTTSLGLCDKLISHSVNNPLLSHISANAYLIKGEIFSRQANWEMSFSNIKDARNIFTSINDNTGIAKCENLSGTIYGDLGDLTNAIEHFERALSIVNEQDNYAFTGKIEINLGIVNTIQGKYDMAVSYFRRAMINFEKISELKRISEIHHNLGMVYTKKNDFNSALKSFDESIILSVKLGYLQTCGLAYLSKAYVYSQMKDFRLSLAFADKAMEIAYKLDDKLTIAEVYKIKGIIQRDSGNHNASENLLLTSLRINQETGNKLNEAETYHELGILYKEMNNQMKSKEHLDKALDYFRKINAEPEIKKLESVLKYIV
jgi:tetratricopeptide (TPR) repeat protein